MGYAALFGGIVGMFSFWVIYYQVDVRSFWYEVSMVGWILSWLLWVVGIWQVTR